jgi:hypothetical protein
MHCYGDLPLRTYLRYWSETAPKRYRYARLYPDIVWVSKRGSAPYTSLVVLNDMSELLCKKKTNIGSKQLVYNGELEAIAKASEVVMSIAKKDYTYKVYVDNQASLRRLTNPSDQPGQLQYLRVLRAYRVEGVQIEVLERVPYDCCTPVFLKVVD